VPELDAEDLPRLSTGISEAPCVPFFSHIQSRGVYFGEDISFCRRNQAAGLDVFLDTRIRVYHKGSYCYGIEDVAMEVPYCDSLQVLDVAQPKAAPALFSKDPDVRGALAACYPSEAIPVTFDPSSTLPSGTPPAPEASP
jgi:hypothetical protein